MTQIDATKRDASKRLVLVVGKGRSGTSLFSGILGRLGFHIPQPEIKADETNPRGFGEPRWVVRFHMRLMRERRVTVFDSRAAAWDRLAEVADDEEVVEQLRSWLAVQFVGAHNLVVKDPRIVWFLPLWLRCARDLGAETSFATMLRHPAEVVCSARTWYGTWQADASRAASWLNITLHAEYVTRGSRRAFVRYGDLLEDWSGEMARCAELFDVPWLRDVDPGHYPEVVSFVDPSLRRSAVGWDAVRVPSTLQAMCEDVWGQVSTLAEPGGDNEDARASLDRARAAYIDFYSDAEAVAQSSVTAVKPRRQPASTPGRPARRPRGLAGRSLRRMRRAVPERYREGVPLAGLRESLRASYGLPAVVRVMLLLPPRYRERLPVPVVHAARRIVRALRH
jgi:hypothetical protein